MRANAFKQRIQMHRASCYDCRMMKRFLAFALIPCSAFAQDAYWLDLATRGAVAGIDPCIYASADASAVMARRYAGQTMPDQIRGGAPVAMVQDAYSGPRLMTDEMRAHQAAAFRDAWESRCYAALGAPVADMSDSELLESMNRRLDAMGH